MSQANQSDDQYGREGGGLVTRDFPEDLRLEPEGTGETASMGIVVRVLRAAFFIFVGVLFFVQWLVVRPSYEVSASQSEWTYVLGFSAAILALAFAIPMFARLLDERSVVRVSLVPAAGAALASLANILEDGLQLGWAFYGFVVSAAIIDLGLLTLALMIAFGGRGGHRFLALIPAATMAAIMFYVIAGGILMLATWLAAALAALVIPARRAAPATPTLT